MADRDRLIEIIGDLPFSTEYENYNSWEWAEHFADHLLANGVIIPIRCKDCKYYEEGVREHSCFHPKQECGWNSEGGECLEMKPYDFCSYGALKEREGNG